VQPSKYALRLKTRLCLKLFHVTQTIETETILENSKREYQRFQINAVNWKGIHKMYNKLRVQCNLKDKNLRQSFVCYMKMFET
jgi:gamma-glutamyl-gamma-aminobutyrate hydrolase PuuD